MNKTQSVTGSVTLMLPLVQVCYSVLRPPVADYSMSPFSDLNLFTKGYF